MHVSPLHYSNKTPEMHTWAVRPRQLWTGDREGATLFSLEEIAAWQEIEITVLSGVVGIRGGKDQRNEEKIIS